MNMEYAMHRLDTKLFWYEIFLIKKINNAFEYKFEYNMIKIFYDGYLYNDIVE